MYHRIKMKLVKVRAKIAQRGTLVQSLHIRQLQAAHSVLYVPMDITTAEDTTIIRRQQPLSLARHVKQDISWTVSQLLLIITTTVDLRCITANSVRVEK